VEISAIIGSDRCMCWTIVPGYTYLALEIAILIALAWFQALSQQHMSMDGGGQQGLGVENMLDLMHTGPQGMSREGAQNWLRQALFRDGAGQSPLGMDNM
jgi:hypothetical protein